VSYHETYLLTLEELAVDLLDSFVAAQTCQDKVGTEISFIRGFGV